MIGSFLRGLSTRDVEAVLEDTFEQPLASRSTVSRILEDTRKRYRRWCERRLDEHDIVYLFCDAIYLHAASTGLTRRGRVRASSLIASRQAFRRLFSVVCPMLCVRSG